MAMFCHLHPILVKLVYQVDPDSYMHIKNNIIDEIAQMQRFFY